MAPRRRCQIIVGPVGDGMSIGSSPEIERQAMAKTMVEILVDDLDGSAAVETVRLGWNGEWRELDLSQRNVAALSRALDRYWAAGRPVADDGEGGRGRKSRAARSRRPARDPKTVRAWARYNGIDVPSRGRIPADVQRQYDAAKRTS